MKDRITIIRKNEFVTSSWSGGTTTQLYIYPEGASYADRNFKWRLSSARVDAEESIFTKLPGISRIIMIIEGQIALEHKGEHKTILNPFEQDSFMGDWDTKSFGRAVDFNLMMSDGCTGKLEYIFLKNGSCTDIDIDKISRGTSFTTNAFYVVTGSADFKLKNDKSEIFEGDLLIVTAEADEEDFSIKICSNHEKELRIIKAVIAY